MPQPRLLFIGSRFFGYEKEIALQLTNRGWQVDYFSDCPPNKFAFKVFKKTAMPLARTWCDRHFGQLVTSLASRHYDKVFMLKGEGITRRVASQLRQQIKTAPFILYLWDSIKNLPFGREKLDMFDRVVTFDPIDSAKDIHIEHYPLFYLDSYEQAKTTNQDIDLLFIGTARADRYQILDQIRTQLPSKFVCYYRFFVPSRLMYVMGKLASNAYKGSNPSEFVFHPIPKAEIHAFTARARVIVDVEHTQQTGLTMRTFETIGARKKLATTNPHVKDYDFYNSSNIYVVDRQSPQISPEFVRSPRDNSNQDIVNRYSLSRWIEHVVLS